MPSIKLFKKEINNSIGGFIEEVYACELNHPHLDCKSTEKLVEKAIILFDDLIEKIHLAKREGGKEEFKPLKKKLASAMYAFEKELAKLG